MNTNSTPIETEPSDENKAHILWEETAEQRSGQRAGLIRLLDDVVRPRPKILLRHLRRNHDHRRRGPFWRRGA